MKKVFFLAMLIFYSSSLLAYNDWDFLGEYEFEFSDEYKAPNKRYVHDGSGSCGTVCTKRNETQGIASINNEYWVLAKNDYLDVFLINDDDPFENEEKIISIEYDYHYKNGDPDFKDGFLYLPTTYEHTIHGDTPYLRIYAWDETEKKLWQMAKLDWNNGTAFAAAFPKTKKVFTNFSGSWEKIPTLRGVEIKDDYTIGEQLIKIKTVAKIGDDVISHNPCEFGESYCTQGAAFSPNGRFLFYVRDDPDTYKAGHTGIYVYYIDNKNYKKLLQESSADNRNFEVVYVGFQNIRYDPSAGGGRLDELEGIDVGSYGGYDVHQLMLNNKVGDVDEEYTVYHYKTGDYDDDDVKDIYDNCPFEYNPDQESSNEFGIGDACYDPDDDGFLAEDNCPFIANPDQSDNDDDGVGDVCDPCPVNGNISQYNSREDIDGDGIHDECDNCPEAPNGFVPATLNNELISADIQECSDEEKEEDPLWCFFKENWSGGASKNVYRNDEGFRGNDSIFFQGREIFSRKVWYWQPDHDLDGVGDACDDDYSSVTKLVSSTSSNLFLLRKSQINRYVDLNYKVVGDIEPGSTAKYCWLDFLTINRWGENGYCTTSDNGRGLPTINDSSFGYSHGGDPEPYNRDEGYVAWKTPELSSSMGKISIENKSGDSKSVVEKWDWTENLMTDHPLLYDNYVSSEQEDLKDPFINYTVSVGSAGTEDCSADEDYYYNETERINSNCFNNMLFINARSKRENKKGTELSYYTADKNFDFFSKLVNSGFLKIPSESQKTCNGCVKFSDPGKGVIDLWRYQDNVLTSEPRKLVTGENRIAEFNDNGNVLTFFENDGYIFFGVNDERNPAETVIAGFAPAPQENITKGKAAIVNGRIYFAGENMLYILKRNVDGEPANIGNDLAYKLEEIMQLPYPAEKISFFGVGRDLIMFCDSGNGPVTYMYDGIQLSEIFSDEAPEVRDVFSFSADKWNLFFAGGASDTGNGVEFYRDVWSFSTSYGWRKVADNVDIDMTDTLLKEENGILNIFSRTFPEKEVDTAFINLSTGEVDYGKTALESDLVVMDTEKYCISRKDSKAYPGKEFRNRCDSVEDYQFKNYWFFDYKLSLTGYKDFVFSGGLSGIRTFEINAAGSLEKKHLKIMGAVNSLAVKDNVLYATRSNRVFVFEIKDNGKLKKRKTIKTKGCDNIRISGNKLYTGENRRIVIYDITDPFNPVKEKKVSLSSNIEDLEVHNNYIYAFHDKWFSRSKLALFKIDEQGTVEKKDEVNLSCSDPEFISDTYNVYLGCKNGHRKVELNETEKLEIEGIGGSKNYFRDTYLKDGIIYTVHSGKIFLSR